MQKRQTLTNSASSWKPFSISKKTAAELSLPPFAIMIRSAIRNRSTKSAGVMYSSFPSLSTLNLWGLGPAGVLVRINSPVKRGNFLPPLMTNTNNLVFSGFIRSHKVIIQLNWREGISNVCLILIGRKRLNIFIVNYSD